MKRVSRGRLPRHRKRSSPRPALPERIPGFFAGVRWKEFLELLLGLLNPNRSLDFGEIARLCHAACFSPSRRRSGLRRGVARNRMRTEAGKMPESLIFLTENSPGVSNDRFGLNRHSCTKPRGRLPPWLSGNLHSTPIGFQKLKNPDPVPWQPDRQQQTTSCKLSLF